MSEQIIHTGRKSFVAYVLSGVGTMFALLLFGGPALMAGFNGHAGWALFLAFVALLFVASGVYNLFYLSTIKWAVTDEEVRVMQGILPWRKRSFGHPYDTIFEAYYNFGFFAKLFGYGTIVIRRTEGITTEESETRMNDAAKIVGLINARVKELRKAQRPVAVPAVVAPAARSQVQELADLARLRDAGDISAEEFETMKRRIVGERSPEGRVAAGGGAA